MKHKGKIIVFAILAVIFGITSQIADSMTRGTDSPLMWLSQIFLTFFWICACIAAYFGIAIFAMFLQHQWQFWMLAVLVGMFQGGIQALSRSYFTKIIPAKQSGEYFGLMDICGKGASFVGTTVVSLVSQLTNDVNKGVGMIAFMFIIGGILFYIAARAENASSCSVK